MPPDQTITLHFDGACEPVNPGGVGTYGFVFEGIPGHGAISGWGEAGRGDRMTNNVAEWAGLEKALDRLAGWSIAHEMPGWRLVIRGDSMLVVRQLTGEWQCKAPHLAAARDRCLALLADLGLEWGAEWVPRGENERADALSVAAWEKATGEPFPHRVRD